MRKDGRKGHNRSDNICYNFLPMEANTRKFNNHSKLTECINQSNKTFLMENKLILSMTRIKI